MILEQVFPRRNEPDQPTNLVDRVRLRGGGSPSDRDERVSEGSVPGVLQLQVSVVGHGGAGTPGALVRLEKRHSLILGTIGNGFFFQAHQVRVVNVRGVAAGGEGAGAARHDEVETAQETRSFGVIPIPALAIYF